uniref:MYB transcription factor n=1 Tax=Opuntia streptacantha TaxID=393608 RepID=A0A7C9DW41_OPUST
MGAPKQKWTAEEEAALKAGVRKHGAGKWQTILRDPEFSHVLRSRSNVDLKDKWRNINVTLSGLGSREKARLALKRNPHIPKLDDKAASVKNVRGDEKVGEAMPVALTETPQVVDSKKTYTRLDNLILEAITTLKESKGSDRNAIAMYIEDCYWAPPNFSKLLASKLKFMAANGQLLKVKHRYKIPSSLTSSEARRSSCLESKYKDLPRAGRKELKIFTRPQVVAELEKLKTMSAHEAAAAAAQAVAEAEAAIVEAEKAAREAEAAEAEAEAAQVFAEAALKALKCQKLRAC